MKTQRNNGKSPRIEDDPEYQAATKKLQRLAARLEEVERREKNAKALARKRVAVPGYQDRYGTKELPPVAPEDVVWQTRKEEAVATFFEERPLPAYPSLSEELEKAEFESAALREAVCRQAEVVAEIEHRIVGRIREACAPEDRRNVAHVLENARKLADALDNAIQFRRELQLGRVSTGLWPELFWFARRIGSRGEWSSPVNMLERSVAEHIGRAPDNGGGR